VDQSGNGNDLALAGTFSFSAPSPGSPGGLYLGGNANAYRALYSPALSTSFTFAAWVWTSPAASATGSTLFSVGRSVSSYNGELLISTNSFFDYAGSWGFNPSWVPNTAVAPPAGTWAHVVLVRSGLTAYWYLNGVANGVVPSAQGFSVTYANTFLNLGSDLRGGLTIPSSWAYLTGYLGQVVVLNTALAAVDVASLFTATKGQYVPPPPPPSPLPPPTPPPLTYAAFPGCATAANVRACYALADLYMATQANATAWMAALAVPGAGWTSSSTNYCAWLGVGCAKLTTSTLCSSDSDPDCVLTSLCVPCFEKGSSNRLILPHRRVLSGRGLAGSIPASFGAAATAMPSLSQVYVLPLRSSEQPPSRLHWALAGFWTTMACWVPSLLLLGV